jgi:hypothetical protein
VESPVINHEFVTKHRVIEKHLYLKGICEGCLGTDDSCVH